LTSIDVLQTVPLFQGMTDRTIGIIADLAQPATYAPGDTLTREGDQGESFIVLTSGTADVSQAGRSIRTLGTGDFLGEVSLIDGGPRTATVTATSPIDALVLDRAGFGRLMDEFPSIRLDLVTALAQRLRQRAPDSSD
jgi:CRP-like cAMP-binding protein